MSKLLAWALMLMCLLAVFTNLSLVRGDEDVDESEESDLNEVPADDAADPSEVIDESSDAAAEARAASEVFTTYLFPDYPDKKLPVGEKITVLVGFQNRGNSVYNLSAIGASLHSPFDYNFYVQNFTYREVNAFIAPGEEGTIEYQFTPDKSLEALEFHLSVSLYYNDTTENKFWRSTIYNSTVELVEKASEFTAKTFFSYVLAVAGLGMAGYIFLNVSGGLNKTTERASRGPVSAAAAEAAAASWAAPVYKPKAKSVAFGSAGKRKKAPSTKAAVPSSQ